MKETKDIEDAMVTCIMYAVFFINDLLNSYIFDTMEILKKSRFYKTKLKVRVRNLEKAVKQYNGLINKTKNAGTIADMNDLFQDKLKHDIMVAENTVINYLKKGRIPEADLLGRIAICNVLSNEACHTVEDNIKIHSPRLPRVRALNTMKAESIRSAMICLSHEFEDRLWAEQHYNLDLKNCPDIIAAFNIIRNKLNDPNFIMDVIEGYEEN